MTNDQAALIAAASFYASMKEASTDAVVSTAETFAEWLDNRPIDVRRLGE